MLARNRARSRNRARFLAPIALVAAIAGTYLIVDSTLTAKHATSHTHPAPLTASERRYARTNFYSVQPGDSLTSIAAKTGISAAALATVNPTVDPNSLQAGQRLRLRR